MLEQISWSTYLTFIVFISLVYYVWLYLEYYRPFRGKERSGSTGRFSGLQISGNNSPIVKDHSAYQPQPSANIQPPLMYTGVLSEMEAFMEEAVHTKIDKISLLDKLQAIAKKYGAIEDPADKILLVQLLQQKSRSICFLDLNEGELEGIWNGA